MFARLKHWWTHVHEWKVIGEALIQSGRPHVFGHDNRDPKDWDVTGKQYTLQCETCGNITRKRV